MGCGLGALSHGPKVALRVGLGMMPRREFGMVVAQAGLALSALSASSFGVLVVMIVTAAMITPPLLAITFREADPTTAKAVP